MKKKIIRIEAVNKFEKSYAWSANTLLWDELPKWLLYKIETTMPDYQLKIEYEK